jgi:hypothetical protein
MAGSRFKSGVFSASYSIKYKTVVMARDSRVQLIALNPPARRCMRMLRELPGKMKNAPDEQRRRRRMEMASMVIYHSCKRERKRRYSKIIPCGQRRVK